MRVGCLFGTFDPPHNAHVRIADHIRKHCDLDQVWFVVTPANPFKSHLKLSPENHRLSMVRLAVINKEGLQASGVELDLPKPNYTADSLRFIRQRWPHDEFSLIIGSDNLAGLHTWKHPEDILAHHKVLVYPRPGFKEHLASSPYINNPAVEVVANAPLMDVSSTAVRAAIAEWRPVTDQIDPAVLSYVRQHQLYQD